ncbi:hypothetical protein Tco_0031285 [Tanacetum coccineum]
MIVMMMKTMMMMHDSDDDDEDDDDDEGPSAGSNQGRSTKRRRSDSAASYKVPDENKLQRKTYDIGSFIKWFCRRTGKKKLCKADLEGDKERKIALSISKLKAACYLDFGLEELVPSLWVESECEYDISAVYGITHWWFRRKEFYINKHGYNYLREIILRRADYQEYKISEKDFKNLHPNDF